MEFRDQILDAIKSYRESDVLCDVTIKVEDQSFHVHKLMLAAASPYFKTIFTVDKAKKNEKEIEIEEVTTVAFHACLEFVYMGRTNFAFANIEKVLQASCFFQMWALRDKCVEAIKSTLDAENCVEMWKLAKKFDLEKLDKAAKKMVFENAETLLKNRKILESIDIDLFKEILLSDELVIPGEDMLFEALIDWVEIGSEERDEYFCKYYQLIRLPQMPKDYFRNTIMMNEHFYRECDKCSSYSQQVVGLFLGAENDGLAEHLLRKRNYTVEKEKKIDMLVFSQQNKIFGFNLFDTTFYGLGIPKSPVKIYNRHITLHSPKIYLVGGNDHTRVFVYDFRVTNEWQELESLPIIHYSGTVVNFGKSVLMAGGGHAHEDIYMDQVEAFDIESKTWSELPKLNVARSLMAGASHKDDVYLIGGFNGSASAVVEHFDQTAKIWEEIPNLNHARYDAAAAYCNDKVFAIGGWNRGALSSVETYDKGSPCWTVTAPLNFGRKLPGASVFNDKIIVFGGLRDRKTCLYERYEDEKWKESELKIDEIKCCAIFNIVTPRVPPPPGDDED